MLKPIQHIRAIKILEEYPTKGSGPLKVIGEDDNLYVAKFTDQTHPYRELINEVICGYLARAMDLKVPEMTIISISKEVAEDFNFSKRYKPAYFDQLFFGSKLIEQVVDFRDYINGVTKSEYNKFENALDFLKIGCFDWWIGNKDRKKENPNLLISTSLNNGKLQFQPIDHCAAFAYLPYHDVRDIMLHLSNSIMESGFTDSIAKWEEKDKLVNLKNNLEICFKNSLNHLDFIFDQVPKEWGFSKKAKEKLKVFFADEQRIKRISGKYFDYLKS